jgi:transcriptional regulator with XRE-family HTH domain
VDQVPDASDASARIGPRLADLRTARKVRVSDLARRVSVSPSLISQIERGQSRPSVTTLFALAAALQVPVDAFFSEEPPTVTPVVDAPPVPTGTWSGSTGAGGPTPVLHAEERPTIDIRGGVRWERLTPTALQGMEFMELVYQPGAESAEELYRHPGIEMVLVLSGRMDIHIGFEVNVLEVGDSIAFPSSLPHRYVNPTDEVARAVTVILRDDMSTLPR